jgi:hypothetical protein
VADIEADDCSLHYFFLSDGLCVSRCIQICAQFWMQICMQLLICCIQFCAQFFICCAQFWMQFWMQFCLHRPGESSSGNSNRHTKHVKLHRFQFNLNGGFRGAAALPGELGWAKGGRKESRAGVLEKPRAPASRPASAPPEGALVAADRAPKPERDKP